MQPILQCLENGDMEGWRNNVDIYTGGEEEKTNVRDKQEHLERVPQPKLGE